MLSQVHPQEKVLSSDNTCQLSVAWKQNTHMSEGHASEYSHAVFNTICRENSCWSVVHVRSEIYSLVSEFFKDVFHFIVNFSVHSQVWCGEVLPWNDLTLWHWWEINLILMKVFQALNYSVNFIKLRVSFMGPLFLGGSSIYFV